jgi:hypothetical protein
MVGMQLPEKYKDNFDVSSPSPGDKTKTIQEQKLYWPIFTTIKDIK